MRQYDYFVYMLECADGKYYVGVTNDVQRRFQEHQQGLHPTSFTFTRRPLKLIYHALFHDIWEAIHWEKQLKRWSAKKKRALTNGDVQTLKRSAVCTNDTHCKHTHRDERIRTCRAESRYDLLLHIAHVIPSGVEG